MSLNQTGSENLVYIKIYYVDSNGTSNKTLIKDGSSDTTAFKATSVNGIVLVENSLYVASQTLPDITKRIIIEVYVQQPTGNTNSHNITAYFRNGEQSHIHTGLVDIAVGATGPTGPGFSYPTTTYGEYLYSNGSTFVVGGSKISLGNNAGQVDQSSNAVAIGQNAGKTSQGPHAIAIGAGAGTSNQGSNSIIINATGIDISNNAANTLYIAPISSSSNVNPTLMYNTTTNEINYSTSKTFVIDHPTNPNRYLVHACLEGPEAGVYYRGKAEITNNQTKSTTIHLPEYASALATDFTITLTPVYNGSNTLLCMSEVENNSFNVYGEPCNFHWVVYAKRSDIIVEPVKDSITLKGDGPYKYIAN
jgi:hypothetical protein